ncbi:MAG: hypothetical protein ACKODX_01860 [Gemmata sp.]
MRRWLAAFLMFAAAAGLTALSAPRAAADLPAPKEVSFTTADGVQLKGVFHATDKSPNSAPVVILLYPPGPDRDMTKGDWVGLAKRLNEEGYHAFRFDWRGHGKSTDIKDLDKFWGNPLLSAYNSNIKGGLPKKTKETLSYKDLQRPEKYLPAYLNDLAAIRQNLDLKNDGGVLSSSSIYFIGAGDAATLGMAWMTAEWQRPAVFPTGKLGMMGLTPIADYRYIPQPIVGDLPPEAGNDIAGAVWLTATRPTTVPEATVKKWVTQAPKLRVNNQMLFLYADKDAPGKRQSEFFYNEALVANPPKSSTLKPLKQTFIKEVKGGNTLTGVKLLDNAELKVQDDIIKFLSAIQKERADRTQQERKYPTPYQVDVRQFGFTP